MSLASSPEVGAAGGDVAAFLQQILKAQADSKAAPADEKPVEPPAKTETQAHSKADEKPVDVTGWLKEIDGKFRAMEAKEKAAQEAKEKGDLAKQVSNFLKEGDLAKAKQAMEALEQHFASKVSEKDKALQDTLAKLDATTLETSVSKAVAAAGVTWASGAAGKQAVALLEQKAEVVTDAAGNKSVREKGTGRSLDEMVKDALASEDFDHFIAATQRKGGLGKGDSANPGPKFGEKLGPMDAVKLAIEAQRKALKADGLYPTSAWPGARVG